MCGINGIINYRNKLNDIDIIVSKMNDAMTHRGPDQSGYYSDKYCSLAMRRLSIIDLSNGKQPVYNEDKSILVFFNGEIYNFLELKDDLLLKGHVFYTNTDTEVLVHLYEEYKESMFVMLKGMFSFCIYDIIDEKWVIARDRFGEKPLFYFYNDDFFSFSSEIYSLLQNSNIPRTLNKRLITDYLSNGIIPDPDTLFLNIFSLEPGSYLIINHAIVEKNHFFKINYDTDFSIKTTEDCLDLLRPVLTNAVKSQMISDVPIGAFLSGGIDSSSIVANLQSISTKPIQTFTVKFDNSKYDESKIAREVSEFLGTEHHEILIPNNGFSEELFWKIIKHIGLPFPDSSAIPTYYISKEIKSFVKVAISGDGGDEMFAGYPFYNWWGKINKLRIVPNFLLDWVRLFLEESTLNKTSTGRSISRAILATKGNVNEIGARSSILFTETETKFLTNGLSSDFTNLSNFPNESNDWTSLKKALYYRLKFDLPLDMLVKVDRMSMANSLEVRAPFLDPSIFDVVSKIPPALLVQNGKNKFLLRKLMEHKLPNSVFDHPKSGFSIPLHDYFNEEFKNMCNKYILENKKMKILFNSNALNFFINRGLEQKVDSEITVYRASHQVWSLLQLGGWLNYFDVDVE
jgi:asparagine synthase (glutamine-hydrolysing)